MGAYLLPCLLVSMLQNGEVPRMLCMPSLEFPVMQYFNPRSQFATTRMVRCWPQGPADGCKSRVWVLSQQRCLH